MRIADRSRLMLFFVAVVACASEPGDTPSPGPIVVDASAFHVFATSDQIASVEDLAVLDDGSVWALNSVEPLLLGFDSEGEAIGTRGQLGGGPNEFGAPVGFVGGGLGGEAWVFDVRRHALIRASGAAESREELPLPRDAIPPGTVTTGLGVLSGAIRTARLGDEVIVPRRIGAGELPATAYWTVMFESELVALRPETGAVRAVVSLPAVLGDLQAHFEAVGAGFPPFPLWFRLWAVCPGGESGSAGGDRSGDVLRIYDFVRDQLRGFTADGAELEPIPVPAPFTTATAREFALAAFDLAAAERVGAVTPGMADMSAADSARILDAMVPSLQGTPEQLAAMLPKFVDFRCADDDTMWLRPLDLDRGGMEGGPGWLRIAPDGATREVRFPERFDPYRFVGGRVWGVLRDELDVASIAWLDTPGDS